MFVSCAKFASVAACTPVLSSCAGLAGLSSCFLLHLHYVSFPCAVVQMLIYTLESGCVSKFITLFSWLLLLPTSNSKITISMMQE